MAERNDWEPQRRARRRALQALYQWLMTGQDASEIVVQFLETQEFDGVDTELFQSLVFGVARQHDDLVARLAPVMHRPMDQCEVVERAALLMGAWMLGNDPNLPFQIVLDESTDLARRFGSESGYAYVNAVLNRLVDSTASAPPA